MTELEKTIDSLKVALQNKSLYANKTQEEIIKLLPFIEKAQKTKAISDAILLDIVLKTRRLLNFTPETLSIKGKKYRCVLDEAYYRYPDLHDRLAIYELDRRGINMRTKLIEFSSAYSEIHDEFEKLIDSVPGKRNELLTILAVTFLIIGLMITLIGSLVPFYPVLTAGILMVALGFIATVHNYARTEFAGQMFNVSKARQDDKKNISAKIQSGRLSDPVENNFPFFLPKRNNIQPEIRTNEYNNVA